MHTVGIVGENAEEMAETFYRLPYGGIRIVSGIGTGGAALDALVAQDAKPVLSRAIAALKDGAFLILNSDKKEILPFLAKKSGAFRLITYGFNSKACVTASSAMDGVLQACVQRGFTSLNGQTLEPREFDFPYDTDAGAALGMAAMCLACGLI